MRLKEITDYLEAIAAPNLQEDYDNSGLQTGNPDAEITKAMVSLDVTEEVVDEAIAKNCELIIAHHPLIFKGIKSLSGQNYVERSLIKAIKSDIAIYAIHTNLDNVFEGGVNQRIGEKLGVNGMQILAPKKGLLQKLVVFVPHNSKEKLMEALFKAGAGKISDYDECSFSLEGTGSFRGNENTNPTVGEVGKRHYEAETRLEMIVDKSRMRAVLSAMWEAHPYEEVAYDVYDLANGHPTVGAGMMGHFVEPEYTFNLLQKIKNTFGGLLRHTNLIKDEVSKIAWCGGSGSFLLPQAKAAGAEVFISSDFKYHQFFEAENEIIIVDIGHYENEQFTKELLAQKLTEKFPNFAVLLTETNTNPINYL